jgi:hypothetical protein
MSLVASTCDPIRCGKRTTLDECNESVGCIWDNSNKCLSKAGSRCEEAKSQGVCFNLPSCAWDPSGVCLDRLRSTCSATAESSCIQLVGCAWQNQTQRCESRRGKAYFCSSWLTEPDCIADECIWNQTTCISKTSYCSTPQNPGTCQRLGGCIWDPSNRCLSQSSSFCILATAYDTCIGISGCIWKNGKCAQAD